MTALEECRQAVAEKRYECNNCWPWILAGPVGIGLCYALCGGQADALERRCIEGAFAAEK